jgi:hypothetical protein
MLQNSIPRPSGSLINFSTFIIEYGDIARGAADVDADLFIFDDAHVRFPMATVSIILSSLLPVLAIIALYSIKSTGLRLGIIALFTAAFSLALVLVTNASRAENFAATAASVLLYQTRYCSRSADIIRFAAVQVVFIGTNGPNF